MRDEEMARPERLIPRFAHHPFGAHFVRLSSGSALLGANAARRAAQFVDRSLHRNLWFDKSAMRAPVA